MKVLKGSQIEEHAFRRLVHLKHTLSHWLSSKSKTTSFEEINAQSGLDVDNNVSRGSDVCTVVSVSVAQRPASHPNGVPDSLFTHMRYLTASGCLKRVVGLFRIHVAALIT